MYEKIVHIKFFSTSLIFLYSLQFLKIDEFITSPSSFYVLRPKIVTLDGLFRYE